MKQLKIKNVLKHTKKERRKMKKLSRKNRYKLLNAQLHLPMGQILVVSRNEVLFFFLLNVAALHFYLIENILFPARLCVYPPLPVSPFLFL